MSGRPILAVTDVVKDFSAVRAVARMTFDVRPGEVFALLGPNGAGKSTLLRMLLGLLHPDSGDIAYHLDGAPRRVPEPHDIGYLPEERGLYQDVGVRRTLRYFGLLRGMSRSSAQQAAETWLERMDLADRGDEPVKALSKGNQQKIQFISAVLHRPRIAVLDEPFSGLDPLNQELFLDLIGQLRDEGTTVLLSAHQMQLVERIADRLIIMNRGRTVLSGTIPEIRRKWRTGSRIVLRVDGDADTAFIDRHAPRATARMTAPGEVELFVEDGMPLGALLADAGSRLDIREIETHAVTLHDVYVGSIGADAVQDESTAGNTRVEAK